MDSTAREEPPVLLSVNVGRPAEHEWSTHGDVIVSEALRGEDVVAHRPMSINWTFMSRRDCPGIDRQASASYQWFGATARLTLVAGILAPRLCPVLCVPV